MNHPRPDRGGRLRHGAGAFGLHGVEGLRAALGEDADEIDGDVGVAHRGLDRGRVAQIGLHGVDLADLAERLQMPGQFRPPHRHPDPVIALAERADHASPQKARPSENRDQGVQIEIAMGVISCGSNSVDRRDIWPFRDTPSFPDCTAYLSCTPCQFDKRATDPY